MTGTNRSTGSTTSELPNQGDRSNSQSPLLTVLIPLFNEQSTIEEVLRRVCSLPISMQVIVIDDCSNDDSLQILQRLERLYPVVVLQHDRNRGKGAAIRTGLESAIGRYTIIQDADLEYDPNDIPRLLPLMIEGEKIAVFGSRYLANPIRWYRPRRLFEFGVLLLNWAVQVIYGIKITDEATCYKVFATSDLRSMQLQCKRFEFCPEAIAKACRIGIKIVEIPVTYSPRTAQSGKKLRALDGWAAIRTLWQYRNWCK